MIVMKFGGSSLASTASFRQVFAIVEAEKHRRPAIVASAMGDTTDLLLEIAKEARCAHTFAGFKLQDAVKNLHFSVCESLLSGRRREFVECYLRKTFRDLHVRILELSEGERLYTPELQDWIVSIGEQLSSRLLAEALDEHVAPTTHLDATKLIVTNSKFTDAEPRDWETFARIRWAVPVAARNELVVLGGFIGSTEDGRTTTLGRGGSDLTASLVGAAINAEEIQVWKDVDGMLTCDPRVLRGGHRVKQLTYQEAAELAQAGAIILHPKTMEPARRLRIPITIRNTFHPETEGTRIEHVTAQTDETVKSIAIKRKCTLLEAHPLTPDGSCESLVDLCKRIGSAATVLSSSESAVYIALEEGARISEENLTTSPCLQVRIRGEQAIVTLVGGLAKKEAIATRVSASLQGIPFVIIPDLQSECSIRLSVPEQQLQRCVEVLHRNLFARPDENLFAAARVPIHGHSTRAALAPLQEAASPLREFRPSITLVQAN